MRKKGYLFFMIIVAIFLIHTVEKKTVFSDTESVQPYATPGIPRLPADAQNSAVNLAEAFTMPSGVDSFIDPVDKNVVIIAPDAYNQKGGLWYDYQIDLTKDFEFDGYVFNGYQGGADGMTFTFHNDPRGLSALGDFGGGLGAYGINSPSTSNRPIANALSLEVDLYRNNFDSAITNIPRSSLLPHAALVVPGTNSQMQTTNKHMDPVYPRNRAEQNRVWSPSTTNAFWNTLKIKWNSSTHEFTWQFALFPEKTRVIDPQTYFKGEKVWWGFTGATGSLKTPIAVAIKKLPQTPDATIGKKVRNVTKKETNFSNKTSADVGNILEYQIEINNLPESVVPFVKTIVSENITHTSFVPNSMKINNVAIANPTVDANQNFSVNLDKIDINQKKVLTFQVKVEAADADSKVLNTAKVASTYSEERTTNQTEVLISPNISLKKDVDQSDGKVGDELTYTLTLSNAANHGAWQGSLTDVLENKLAVISGSTVLTHPDGTKQTLPGTAWIGQMLTVNNLTIKGGEKVTVTFKAEIKMNVGAAVENVASYQGTNVNQTIVFNGESNRVSTKLSMPILHIKQVILAANTELPIPTIGYHQLRQVAEDDNNKVLSITPTISPSGIQATTLTSKKVTFLLESDKAKTFVETMIPTYYQYDGFNVTDVDIPHLEDNRDKQNPLLLDYAKKSEYWVTVYLKPTTNLPRPYSWEYQSMTIGEIK